MTRKQCRTQATELGVDSKTSERAQAVFSSTKRECEEAKLAMCRNGAA